MTKTSESRLQECHEYLVKLIKRVDELYPIQVVCGFRDNAAQEKAFNEGKSKLKPGKSKHNRRPSLAVDIVPDPDNNPKTLDWNDVEEFEKMCLVVEQVADELDIKIRLGRDFSFKDYPHIELI